MATCIRCGSEFDPEQVRLTIDSRYEPGIYENSYEGVCEECADYEISTGESTYEAMCESDDFDLDDD
jgi:hypothetical protein